MLCGVFPYMPVVKSAEGMKAVIRKGTPRPSFKPAGRGIEVPDAAIQFVKVLLTRERARTSMQAVLGQSFLAKMPIPMEPLQVKPALNMARAATRDFNECPDPTVQRSLDELMQRLQTQQKDRSTAWFSETPRQTKEMDESCQDSDDAPVMKRKARSRFSTHSGSSFQSLRFSDDGDVSTQSPQSSRQSTPEEPWSPRFAGQP